MSPTLSVMMNVLGFEGASLSVRLKVVLESGTASSELLTSVALLSDTSEGAMPDDSAVPSCLVACCSAG